MKRNEKKMQRRRKKDNKDEIGYEKKEKQRKV